MDVLIVGGGIAGLTVASLLSQRNVNYSIIEKSAEYPKDVGYVLSLWPLGSRILHGLNLYDKFVASSQELREYKVCNTQGQLLHSYNMTAFLNKYGGLYGILHSELIDLLRETAGTVRMSTVLQKITQKDNKVHVVFNDNSEGTYDLVIAADGIHSQVRKLLLGDQFLKYLGWGGWAWWIDPAIMPSNLVTEYWGNAHFFGLYPAKDKLCCFVSVQQDSQIHPDSLDHKLLTIEKEFRDFGGYIPEILDCSKDVKNIYHTGFYDSTSNLWAEDRVVFIGDAGQLILPTAGIGASVAMESAAALADELSRACHKTIPYALQCYIKRHRKRVEMIQTQSRALARLMTTRSAWIATLRNQVMKMYSQRMFFKGFEKVLNDPI